MGPERSCTRMMHLEVGLGVRVANAGCTHLQAANVLEQVAPAGWGHGRGRACCLTISLAAAAAAAAVNEAAPDAQHPAGRLRRAGLLVLGKRAGHGKGGGEAMKGLGGLRSSHKMPPANNDGSTDTHSPHERVHTHLILMLCVNIHAKSLADVASSSRIAGRPCECAS